MVFGVKNLIKSRVNPLVWQNFSLAKHEYQMRKRHFHCDDALVPLFKKYVSNFRGFYVDVGANDGRSASNTYHLEKHQQWTGILIEPIMHVHFKSRQLRDLEANKFFNCACVSKDFQEDHIELLYSGLMSVSKSGFQEYEPNKWAELGSQFLQKGETVQRTWSQARTLDSILVEAESPRVVDLLSIDVEGAEFGVLQGIDFDSWVFKYILIETVVDSKAYKHLNNLGYVHIETISQNLFFSHPSLA